MLTLLNGIRVVDLTTVVLGPYATRLLGDLGAEVIKVEPLSGDIFRSVRPGHSDEMGAGFINANRNKRSIALDLRDGEALAALHAIIAGADVVVHNMRPKSAERLGVGFEQLRAVNPGLIYCYAPGFGQDGPLADEPAYDDTIQAVSGLAWLNQNAAGEPRFLSTIIADKVGGLHLAISVLAALAARNRGGEAVSIETPMFESLVSFLMVEQLAGRSFDPPLGGIGYDRLLSPYRKPFRTADGFVSIIPYNATHWIAFLRLIGRDDLTDDPRVTDSVERSRNIDMLYALIEAATPHRTTAAWIEQLKARDVPCAQVNRLEDLFEHPHLQAVGLFGREDHPTEGTLNVVRAPFRIAGEAAEPDRATPVLGQDSRALLARAGLAPAAIDALFQRGVALDGAAEAAA
ncbi:CoA transferase [Sphingomonas sp. HF-S3]|uniref:CoA transferase n=1 Tax=Sphingomonas rustica TaxID=3103142 RepID=A0ABV0B2Y4_9SPHN